MAKMIFGRAGLGFVPVDEAAQAFTMRIKAGDLVMVEARRPRDIGQHRRLWKLMTLVADNLPGVTKETVLDVVKIRTGCVNVLKTRTGEIQVPKSIAFESMDQIEFDAFFERAVQFILSDILPGVTRPELEAAIRDWARAA